MRGRRNTNLSISSASLSSNQNSPVVPATAEADEKGRFLWILPPPHKGSLPSPYAKAERESRQALSSRIAIRTLLRYLFGTIAFVLVWYCWSRAHLTSYITTRHEEIAGHHYELLDRKSLPEHPGPIIVQDRNGRQRWTMSVPHESSFPLRPRQYRDMCRKGEQVSRKVRHHSMFPSRILGRKGHMTLTSSYYTRDHGFIDVAEAEEIGILPATNTSLPMSAFVEDDERRPGLIEDVPVCEKSLTFVMDAGDVGFGNTLLQLWMAYGLAKKEGRAFFLDDRAWLYGRYLSYFHAPPQPSCAPPPPSHIIPCPHDTRHLLVSAATMSWTFGERFDDYFTAKRHYGVWKQKQIYEMLRRGYEDLFHLKGEDNMFVMQRTNELKAKAALSQQPTLGMHIRRGDRHPFEMQYASDYLPLDRFTSAALRGHHGTSARSRKVGNSTNSQTQIPLLLASDDPDIIVHPDLLVPLAISTSSGSIDLQRSQSRILLASKRTLSPAEPIRTPGSAYVKHVDENSGWEGGFYASLFKALGGVDGDGRRWNGLSFHSQKEFRKALEERMQQWSTRHRQSTYQSTAKMALETAGREAAAIDKELEKEQKLHEQAQALRELVGRAYLLDIAVLAKADRVVCAVSSASCRVLGVMMGWDAVVKNDWVNVDDAARRGWSWDGRL